MAYALRQAGRIPAKGVSTMSYLLMFVLGIVVFVAAGQVYRFLENRDSKLLWLLRSPAMVRTAGAAIAIFGFLSTSFVTISPHGVGHLKRVYFGASMPPGRIIALPGENGPQAEILAPGFHIRPFVNILYQVEEREVVDIPPGQYGLLTAKDGRPLGTGQFIAAGWPAGKEADMLNAEYFIANGGQKGPQLTVLEPGQYRFNQYLFDLRIGKALDVPAGTVAVIKSNVQERQDCPTATEVLKEQEAEGGLAIPLVPRGCIGVWDVPLLPNRYYLNEMAYAATNIPVQVQTWNYKGGYTARQIYVTVDHDGKLNQKESAPMDIPVPKEAADSAVILTIEGWRVPLELRALVQVEPVNAPKVVASVGDLAAIEDKIISPTIRSVVRNETQNFRVIDLLTRRAEIEKAVEDAIVPEGLKAGVTIKEIRFGDPVIPPELLIATQRKQLAEQLSQTYIQEQKAQAERINTEKTRATADQQGKLVSAEIGVKVAEQTRERQRLEGEGEKLRLTEIAAGQKAQADVLGQDKVLELAMLKEILAVARDNPDLIKVPAVLVQGAGADSLTGAAAVLGASNLSQMLSNLGGKRASEPAVTEPPPQP